MADAKTDEAGTPATTPDGAPADAAYMDSLGDMPPGLVFIFGCHRSGTTLLYHLLAETGHFNYVTAYHLINYDELLRNHAEGRTAVVRAALDKDIKGKQSDRMIDRLPVGAGLPEEYRFVLAQEIPDIFQRAKELIFAPHLTAKTKDRFVELCRKVEATADRSRPLLLKNPNDFYRNFEGIHGMFPGQKSIIIHRHPLHIVNSLVVNWDAIFKEQSHYLSMLDPQYASLFDAPPIARTITRGFLKSPFNSRMLISGIAEGLDHYLRKIGDLPADSYVEFTYEDFCREPAPILGRIGDFLGVGLADVLAEGAIAPRRQPILPVVEKAYRRRIKALTPYLERFGYDPWPDQS